MKPNIDPIIIRRGLHVSLLVGSIMILINQGPAMAVGELPAYWQVALTYAVPFLVFTFSNYLTQKRIVSR